ncbi:MAG: glutathione S-transferase family protein [Granulosicoccaceae bacterium]
MKLYGHPDSGHAFKVKFFLQWANVEHNYEMIDIFSPRESRPAEFLNASKHCEVPCLVDGDQNLIHSNAILVHLANKLGHLDDADSRQRNLEWLVWEANKIGLCLPQLRADKRFEDSRLSEGAREWLRARYDHDVGVIDNELSDGRAFILGDAPNIADFSLYGYLVHVLEAEVPVPSHVSQWVDRMSALEGFEHPYEMLKA